MENQYARKYTPRKTTATADPSPSPARKLMADAMPKGSPDGGSKSAPSRIKHSAQKQTKKSVTFTKEGPSSQAEATPQKTPKASKKSPLKEKNPIEATPKKKRSVPRDDFKYKGMKRKTPTAAEKAKFKVFGDEPKATVSGSTASLFGSDSSTESSDHQPKKKVKTSDFTKTSVPEGVGRWFSNTDLAAAFVKNYAGKVVAPLKYLNIAEFLGSNLSCINNLVCQGIRTFLEFKHDLYPDLVKVFYCNFTFKNGIIRSKVKGVNIKVTLDEFREYFQIRENNPETGDSSGFQNYDRIEFYKSMCKPSEIENLNFSVLRTGPLNAEDRLLHYFITYLVQPRGCNHAILMDSDLYTMYAIKHRIQYDWGSTFAHHMKKSRHLQYLPFGFHISYLLNISGVNIKGETTVPPRSINLIDKASLGRLDVGWNAELGTFDYISDHSVRIRRSKPSHPSSSRAPRHRSQTPLSLLEKVETLTNLLQETKAEMHDRMNKLEALILRLIPPTWPPTPEASPQHTEAATPHSTEDPPPVQEDVPAPNHEEEGGTEPLLDVDVDDEGNQKQQAIDTEVEEDREVAEEELVPAEVPQITPEVVPTSADEPIPLEDPASRPEAPQSSDVPSTSEVVTPAEPPHVTDDTVQQVLLELRKAYPFCFSSHPSVSDLD